MDNDFFYNNGVLSWQLLSSTMDAHPGELNYSPGNSPAPECFINPSWEKSTDQNLQFSSALSSMVSSPVMSNSNISNESSVIRELIGKLVTVGDPLMDHTSYYHTPLNSPPKLNNMVNSVPANSSLFEVSGDPGFAERAARFSCFGSRSFNSRTSQSNQYLLNNNNNVELPYGKIGRVASSPSLKALESKSLMGNQFNNEVKFSRFSNSPAQFNKSREESLLSQQIPGGETAMKSSNDMNSRKRKPASKEKPKTTKAVDNQNSKRRKTTQDNENEEVQEQKDSNTKADEPLKDYIHVRARRGQATDSHSLAERVRREKIGERMKLLQDLVPGCNKVTGKALMLDEIINYVQSLQYQVEFLSMKLASVDFRTNPNQENHLSKNINQLNGSSQHQLPFLEGFNQGGIPQFPSLCEDDLQSLVQMGLPRI